MQRTALKLAHHPKLYDIQHFAAISSDVQQERMHHTCTCSVNTHRVCLIDDGVSTHQILKCWMCMQELSGLTPAERRMKQNLPVVTLTLWDHPHTMTLEQLRQLSLPQLSSIWTVSL